MSKGIELTQSQIKAIENGATMIIVPLKHQPFYVKHEHYGWCCNTKETEILGDDTLVYGGHKQELLKRLKYEAPIQIGDKDIFIKEEFGISLNDSIAYMSDYTDTDMNVTAGLIDWIPASQMTKEQSRFKDWECIDIRVVKVQDITLDECGKAYGYRDYRYCYNMLVKDVDYKRDMALHNDYVFIIEFRR